MPRNNATTVDVRRDGETLAFAGVLSRDAVASAWTRALALIAGVKRFDLSGVASVDSAGLALLAELASRAGSRIAVVGDPQGLAELRAAYRLDAALDFAAA
jgi:phospholipid transport system transporter-binding protein